ncbi:hypothetical protein TEQG_04389 [Trichophyton equinum CBS 127.97]|uniref:Uncharacterized protein n=1 Tax=Trichophyton equinum (strain ATCC MYA-4606 / CBS 127.97) TaxID=559882 RepID=F2PTL4_TRIEC|nr:hypothetical protein TEQG_04389 [Trichophyton equinum CBS 127.97]
MPGVSTAEHEIIIVIHPPVLSPGLAPSRPLSASFVVVVWSIQTASFKEPHRGARRIDVTGRLPSEGEVHVSPGILPASLVDDQHKQNEEPARQVDDGIGGMGNGIMITAAKHANMTGNNKISLRNGKISSR